MRLKADLTLLFVSIIWGSAFVAQRVAGQLESVYLFNGARYLLAAVVVLPFALPIRRTLAPHAVLSWRSVPESKGVANPPQGKAYQQYKWIFIAGFVLFIASAFQQRGVVYTTAGNAGFITGLYVVLVPLVLFILWHEKTHWISIIAIVLAGIGAFFLSTGGRFEVRLGDVIELVGAFFWTFHVIILGKYASKFDPMSFSVGQLIICGLLNLVVGSFVEKSMPLNLPIFAAILYTALFSLGLCYTLQVWAQRHTPPADAALILSLESVFAVISGWWLLGEKLAAIQIFGCVLIFVAVLLSQLKEGNRGSKIDPTHLVEGR